MCFVRRCTDSPGMISSHLPHASKKQPTFSRSRHACWQQRFWASSAARSIPSGPGQVCGPRACHSVPQREPVIHETKTSKTEYAWKGHSKIAPSNGHCTCGGKICWKRCSPNYDPFNPLAIDSIDSLNFLSFCSSTCVKRFWSPPILFLVHVRLKKMFRPWLLQPQLWPCSEWC